MREKNNNKAGLGLGAAGSADTALRRVRVVGRMERRGEDLEGGGAIFLVFFWVFV